MRLVGWSNPSYSKIFSLMYIDWERWTWCYDSQLLGIKKTFYGLKQYNEWRSGNVCGRYDHLKGSEHELVFKDWMSSLSTRPFVWHFACGHLVFATRSDTKKGGAMNKTFWVIFIFQFTYHDVNDLHWTLVLMVSIKLTSWLSNEVYVHIDKLQLWQLLRYYDWKLNGGPTDRPKPEFIHSSTITKTSTLCGPANRHWPFIYWNKLHDPVRNFFFFKVLIAQLPVRVSNHRSPHFYLVIFAPVSQERLFSLHVSHSILCLKLKTPVYQSMCLQLFKKRKEKRRNTLFYKDW